MKIRIAYLTAFLVCIVAVVYWNYVYYRQEICIIIANTNVETASLWYDPSNFFFKNPPIQLTTIPANSTRSLTAFPGQKLRLFNILQHATSWTIQPDKRFYVKNTNDPYWRHVEAFYQSYRFKHGRHWIHHIDRKPLKSNIPSSLPQFEILSQLPIILMKDHCVPSNSIRDITKFANSKKWSQSSIGGKGKVTQLRSSQTLWIDPNDVPELLQVYQRFSDLLQIPLAQFESFSLVRYKSGGRYANHVDWSASKPHSRYISILVYMNTAVGDTVFPKVDIRVSPQIGRCLLFSNLLADGNGDEKSLHRGDPVEFGEKIIGNIWIWDENL